MQEIPTKLTGFIEKIDRVKEFGFIKTDDGREFFFNFKSLRGNNRPSEHAEHFKKGTLVTFFPVDNSEARKQKETLKDRAVEIRRVSA